MSDQCPGSAGERAKKEQAERHPSMDGHVSIDSGIVAGAASRTQAMLDILNGGNGATEQVTLPHTLVVHASTAPPGTVVNALAVELLTNT